ncbi:MAG: chromate transporter [Chloroflexi bacterium]|nr:chromate transporter [Chloroflexota bacterium]
MTGNALVDLVLLFARLSLVAVGGMNSILPEVHRQVVDVHAWMTDADFAAMVALAQASPGPNGLVSALIGWRVAGLAGFLAAALAGNVPPALVAFCVSRLWRRLAHSPWLRAVQAGLVPIIVGLMFASGLVIARAADHTLVEAAVTVVVALAVWRSRLNPFWLLGGAALAGLALAR